MKPFPTPAVRRALAAGAVTALIAPSSACALFEAKKPPQPPCPQVSVLADASKLTHFRPGPGRDITDMVLGAEVTGFHGSCHYDYDTKVLTMTLQIEMNLTRGAAAQGRQAEVDYFVAIPAYYPSPNAKQVLPVHVQFPTSSDRLRITDNEVDISVPIKDVKVDYAKIEVFLGLQLSQEELDYNRSHKPNAP